MKALLLEPHNDDCALFVAYTALRDHPHAITVFRSHLQEIRGLGITSERRERESECAMRELGCTWEQWGYLDSAPPPWEEIQQRIEELVKEYDHVYAPQPYPSGGHPQHDGLGLAAARAVATHGPALTLYHTYVNGRGRVEGRHLVRIEDPSWVPAKLRALACYESQILEPSTGHHFSAPLDEWYS